MLMLLSVMVLLIVMPVSVFATELTATIECDSTTFEFYDSDEDKDGYFSLGYVTADKDGWYSDIDNPITITSNSDKKISKVEITVSYTELNEGEYDENTLSASSGSFEKKTSVSVGDVFVLNIDDPVKSLTITSALDIDLILFDTATIYYEEEPVCPHDSLKSIEIEYPGPTKNGHLPYFACNDCKRCFEDEDCQREIEDIETWLDGEGSIKSLDSGNEKYQITKGKGTVIDIGNIEDVLFESDADINGFICVFVDNGIIDKENYTAESGSTKITLKKTYLKSLKEGVHNITIVSKDGHAKTEFTLERKTEPKPVPVPPYVVPDTSTK